jgi:hypothetical protein
VFGGVRKEWVQKQRVHVCGQDAALVSLKDALQDVDDDRGHVGDSIDRPLAKLQTEIEPNHWTPRRHLEDSPSKHRDIDRRANASRVPSRLRRPQGIVVVRIP